MQGEKEKGEEKKTKLGPPAQWMRLISDELSAGPLHWRWVPLSPAGGTSHRCYYFNYLLSGPSPWQPSPVRSLASGSWSAAPSPSLKSCFFIPGLNASPKGSRSLVIKRGTAGSLCCWAHRWFEGLWCNSTLQWGCWYYGNKSCRLLEDWKGSVGLCQLHFVAEEKLLKGCLPEGMSEKKKGNYLVRAASQGATEDLCTSHTLFFFVWKATSFCRKRPVWDWWLVETSAEYRLSLHTIFSEVSVNRAATRAPG